MPRELLPLYCKTGLLNIKSLVKCFWFLPLDLSNAVFGYLRRVWRVPISPCGGVATAEPAWSGVTTAEPAWGGVTTAEPVCGCLSLTHRLEQRTLLVRLLASALYTLLLWELLVNVCWVSMIAFSLCFLSDPELILIFPLWLSSCAVSLVFSLTLGGCNLQCDFPSQLFTGPSGLSVLSIPGFLWKSGAFVSSFPSFGSGCDGGQMETGKTS